MMKFMLREKLKKYWIYGPVAVSLILNIHNSRVYNPDFGFDGQDHQAYIEYIKSKGKLPLPHEGWETHQPPAYYILAAALKGMKLPIQVINLTIFYVIALLVYRYSRSKTALLAYLALPMVNIFPPMVTNELAGSWFVVWGLLEMLGKSRSGRLALILAMGFYAKYTILTLLPVMVTTYWLQNASWQERIKKTVITGGIFLAAISPLLIRNMVNYHKLMPIAQDFFKFEIPAEARDRHFFTDLSWIAKRQMHGAGKYSFTGGLWNTFWIDGFRVMTPMIEYNKKAMMLWGLGFALAGLAGWGLIQMIKKEPKKAIILAAYVLTAGASLVMFNLEAPYEAAVKAFYAFGLTIPYEWGIKFASQSGRMKVVAATLLAIQMAGMAAYLWINPGWVFAK
jgi:hypothetical protein